MLTELRLTNFKAFDTLTLRCAPITLLCGVNGTGKSTVIQALLLLHQSAASGALRPPDVQLELAGDLAEIGSGRDALHEDADTDVLSFRLRDGEVPGPCEMTFRVLPDEAGESDQLRADHADVDEGWWEMPLLGSNFHYVNAERVGPRKSYSHSETLVRRGDLGARGEYALNYLSERGNTRLPSGDPRLEGAVGRRVLDGIDRWLGEVSPGAHLSFDKVVQADALVAGFSFDREGDVATRRFRATNVGFGLSYTLPVLTALLARPPTLCLIENPEAHLHPRGQTQVANLAVRAALAGVQVIVETHSDHFLDGVRIAVRDGLLRPQDVAIHYFERHGGRSKVTSPEVDADGRLSSWPVGFFDQHEDNLARLLSPKRRTR
ncbi:MAG: DUF3696 domain-containing protein [Gammaproteobacteria bacterium]|nr:DUF3696 domain-containing protein [Gammaproteobacteria bacterium]